MGFISCQEGNFNDVFVTETEIVDRFVGNQLWSWGPNGRGQLGNLTTTGTGASSPVQTVSNVVNWKQVALGCFHVGAIKTDGTLWLWGAGGGGVLGNNSGGDDSSTSQSSPVQTVSSGTNWKQVALGRQHSAAIKTDGTLWLWGCHACGRLGNTILSYGSSSPSQTLTQGTNWKQVALGDNHSAAIKTDGTLWLWGANDCGQLGNNKNNLCSSPLQTIASGNNWKQVSLGQYFSGAIKTDGTLWLWGKNCYGELGSNDSLVKSSPVQTISSGANWKQISLGCGHSGAIKVDGTLWLWGNNTTQGSVSGALGTNDSIDRSSPVQTISMGTNWKQVSLGLIHSAAIKTDGTLWLWGRGNNGELGTNAKVSHSSPVQTVTTGTNWKQVSLGGQNSVAVTFTKF